MLRDINMILLVVKVVIERLEFFTNLMLVYALKSIGLHKGYSVIQRITNHILYVTNVFLHISTKIKSYLVLIG